MDLREVKRFSRHLALPEVGAEGQSIILKAEVALVLGDEPESDVALQALALYLAAAGVRRMRLLSSRSKRPAWTQLLSGVSHSFHAVSTSGASWAAALSGSDVAVRAGFGDDAFVDACRRRRVAGVVFRARPEGGIDLMSLRPDPSTEISSVPSVPPSPGTVPSDWLGPLTTGDWSLAGILAAAEVLWQLCGRSHQSGEAAATAVIRTLTLPSDPLTRPSSFNIPWPSLEAESP